MSIVTVISIVTLTITVVAVTSEIVTTTILACCSYFNKQVCRSNKVSFLRVPLSCCALSCDEIENLRATFEMRQDADIKTGSTSQMAWRRLPPLACAVTSSDSRGQTRAVARSLTRRRGESSGNLRVIAPYRRRMSSVITLWGYARPIERNLWPSSHSCLAAPTIYFLSD